MCAQNNIMKKYFIIGILMFSQNMLHAQKTKVTTEALKAFQTKFPTAKDATWDSEGKNEFEVEFKLEGQKASANFSIKGEWIETEHTITENILPKGFLDNFRKVKRGAKINQIFKVERADGKSYYEIECTIGLIKKEFKIDLNGQLI